MEPKEEMIIESEDYKLDEMTMLIKIGENYQDFKSRMEKYSRDMWF